MKLTFIERKDNLGILFWKAFIGYSELNRTQSFLYLFYTEYDKYSHNCWPFTLQIRIVDFIETCQFSLSSCFK